MLRVTADTNIFISGLNFKGKPFELLTVARAGKIELAMSDAILTEIKRVLSLKFKWPHEDVAAIEKQIEMIHSPAMLTSTACGSGQGRPDRQSHSRMRPCGGLSYGGHRR